jgi:hypothetical protein
VFHLQAIAKVVPSSLILFTLMKAIRSSETSALTRATPRHVPEDGILHVTALKASNFTSIVSIVLQTARSG